VTARGGLLNLFVTTGQVSDYTGAKGLLSGLPDVQWLLGDRGYNAEWFREALKDKGIRAYRETLEAWQEDCNTHRPLSALGNMTPREFAEKMMMDKLAA